MRLRVQVATLAGIPKSVVRSAAEAGKRIESRLQVCARVRQ